MRRTARAILLAAAAAVLGGAPAAQAQPGPDFFGVNVQPMVKLQVVSPDRWDGYVAQMAADGLTVARADAVWGWAEPKAPIDGRHVYEWDPPDRPTQSLDRIALLLARHGVRQLPVLATAPSWAGDDDVSLTPEHYADFAAFAAAYAARYGTGGSLWREHPELAPLPVTDYEIWTEANSTNFWTHKPDPVEYAHAMAPVSAAIHQADPSGRVLASIGWQGFEGYMASFYAAGGKGTFDAVGFHPYAPHAVAIIDLVQRLRKLLVANGEPTKPIDVTETGQPRVATGAGSTRAGSGTVSDQARAATHALAGEALARSDCGVADYLMYANVGSETSTEGGGEGYMGIYSVTGPTPNITGAAMRDASLRWRAAPTTGIALCSGGTTAPAKLLPLELTVDHDSPTCVTGHTTYRGNPLEAAQLTLSTSDGRVSRFETDAFGYGRVCIPDGPPIYTFDVTSVVANVAAAPTLRCPVLGRGCTTVAPPGGVAPAETRIAGGPKRCSYAISLRLSRVTRRRSRATTRLTCAGGKSAAVRVSVLVQRRGHRAQTRVRRLTLRLGKQLAFTVKARLHRGDRLVLKHAADTKLGVPRLAVGASVTRRLVR